MFVRMHQCVFTWAGKFSEARHSDAWWLDFYMHFWILTINEIDIAKYLQLLRAVTGQRS